MYFLEQISERSLRLPHLKRLQMDYIPDNSTAVRQFFKNSFPETLDMLVLFIAHKARYSMDVYIEDIKERLTRVRKEIYLENFDFSKTTFEQVVKASNKWKRLIFDYGKFDAEQEFDFSGPEYEIELLSFFNSDFNPPFNEWGKYPERLENIIKGIKNSGLSKSLKKLDVNVWGIGRKKVQALLDKHGLHNTHAVEQVEKPLED
jgi:hypothetical protein